MIFEGNDIKQREQVEQKYGSGQRACQWSLKIFGWDTFQNGKDDPPITLYAVTIMAMASGHEWAWKTFLCCLRDPPACRRAPHSYCLPRPATIKAPLQVQLIISASTFQVPTIVSFQLLGASNNLIIN